MWEGVSINCKVFIIDDHDSIQKKIFGLHFIKIKVRWFSGESTMYNVHLIIFFLTQHLIAKRLNSRWSIKKNLQ